MRKVLLEALLVAGIGAALSFAANALSPRGLKLTRDFFGLNSPAPTNQLAAVTNVPAGMSTNASPLELLKARIESRGLHLADSNQVIQLFRDPRFGQGLVAFVDAREDGYYQQGHIPNAYQLDYYRPEKYLATVLPVSQMAEQIVVYCNGGNCEDSEFAALFLLAAGIPKEKVLVYGGGMTEWETNGLPVELGLRQSGNFKNVK